MKGPAGYGRYDDDPGHIGCPWSKSDMTPCIARDGTLALSGGYPRGTPQDRYVCVGCGHTPAFLLEDLRDDGGVKIGNIPGIAGMAASRFHELVTQVTDPLAQELIDKKAAP